MIIIQKHLEFYGSILETYWLYGEITDFTEANPSTNSFSLKEKLTCQADNNGTENVEIMVPIKYLSNFWMTLEIPLTNCEITLDLKWC